MNTKIDIWKRQQKKNITRRSRIKKYNSWYNRTHPKIRIKGGAGGGGFTPIKMEAGVMMSIFQMMVAKMTKDKTVKQQGQRGS